MIKGSRASPYTKATESLKFVKNEGLASYRNIVHVLVGTKLMDNAIKKKNIYFISYTAINFDEKNNDLEVFS